MALPDVESEIVDDRPAAGPSTDTGRGYFAAETSRGLEPVIVTSREDAETPLGPELASSLLGPALGGFFRAGGQEAVVVPVVADGATTGEATLEDLAAIETLRVKASSPGEWAGRLRVNIVAPEVDVAQILIFDLDGPGGETDPAEVSPELTSKAAIVEFFEDTLRVRFEDLGAGGMPTAVQDVQLVGGNAQRNTIDDTDLATALARLRYDLGPGQLHLPGRVTAEQWAIALEHTRTHNRFALLDGALTDSSAAALLAKAASAGVRGERFGAGFAPWAGVPGLSTDAVDKIPWSAIQGGLTAARDRVGGPADPAAGQQGGRAPFVQKLFGEWIDADRKLLNEAGINVARWMYRREAWTYGYRTFADQRTDKAWSFVNRARVMMLVRAVLERVAQAHSFEAVRGNTSPMLTDMRGELLALHRQNQFGPADAADAFSVGPVTVADGTTTVRVEAAPADLNERTVIQIVNRSTT